MFVLNVSEKQMSIFNQGYYFTQSKRKLFEQTAAYIFEIVIFPIIHEDEERYRVLFSSNKASRPNSHVDVLVAAFIWKEIYGLTDKQLVEALNFDYRTQRALHIADDETPPSGRTLRRFRARLLEYAAETGIDLFKNTVIKVSKKLAEMMSIDSSVRRMDSLQIESNIRIFSREELIYTCISKLVKKLQKDNVVELPKDLEHYVDRNDFNKNFYIRKNEKKAEVLQQILTDCDRLLDICSGHYDENTKEYKNFVRCINEQTVVDENGRRLAKSEDGTLNASILQNPSDPDATYREKAGEKHRGYVANVDEAVGAKGSIVVDYQLEPNTYSDSQFFGDSMDRTEPSEKPAVVITDGAYASQENFDKAAENNTTLVTTSLSGKEAPDILADFEFNEDGNEITKCPNEQKPIKQSYNASSTQVRAVFDGAGCAACPRRNECTAKLNKNGDKATVYISRTGSNRAKAQRLMKSKEFGPYQRLRNGVETIPSILRRKYGVDRMERGLWRNRLSFGGKIAALNINKFSRFQQGLLKPAKNPLLS